MNSVELAVRFSNMLGDIPLEFAQDMSLPSSHCPRCGKFANYRRGLHYEHLRQCGNCDLSWCPDRVDAMRAFVADSLSNVGGDGI